MHELVELLKKKDYTIAAMESCTGGLFASELTNIPGVSSIFQGSLVSYTNEVKKDVGGIDAALLDEYGAVSLQVAVAMAKQAKEMFHSDVAVSFTGNAGPTASEGKEVGYVCSCAVIKNKSYTFEDTFKGNRNIIRASAVIMMVKRLKHILLEEEEND